MVAFSDRLAHLRKDQGLTKTALAAELGVTTTCVWNWEQGNTQPRAENLKALSELFDVSEDFLQRGDLSDTLQMQGHNGVEHSSALSDVISQAKTQIARAAGISPEKVSISLQY